jgi:tRNA A-37 threonylcarbamoyl transferase component Bud32
MEQIGRYSILGELGRGGFGVVYKARDPKINRVVAIKTIPTQELRSFAGGQQLYERLAREAQSAGSLNHPGIVTVYELAEEEAVTYIVMEFVPGRSLRDVMGAAEPLDTGKKLAIVRQIAEALDFAHQNGIIHRDIKPANILVTDAGVAKIADFGVAKIVSQNSMSATGAAVGTPSYMSPEQILAKGVDGRSDQFSLAVIAYELLTGKQPFLSDSLPGLIHQILSVDPPSPQAVSDEVPRPGADVILRGLAKQADQRFTSCTEFAEALSAAILRKESPAPLAPAPVSAPETAPARSSGAIVKAGLAIGLGIALAAFLLFRGPGTVPASGPAPTPEPAPPTVAAPVAAAPVIEAPKQAPKADPPPVEAAPTVKKPAITPPVATPPAPQVAETRPAEPPDPGPDAPAASYHGPPEGRFTWSGSFGPGERLVIVRNRVRKGSVGGSGLPPGIPLQVTVSPADVKVLQHPRAENGFRLVVANATAMELTSFSIVWRELQN